MLKISQNGSQWQLYIMQLISVMFKYVLIEVDCSV